MSGLTLTFHLAGINNQNFLMKDEETGTYWQQVSGVGLSGPLAGQSLKLIHVDHLTYGQWKSEQVNGNVLKDVAADAADYAPKPWEEAIVKETRREPVIGVSAFGVERAYDEKQVWEEKLIADRLGSTPVIVVVGPDGKSIRIFEVEAGAEFFRTGGTDFMIDNKGVPWDFRGCTSGGRCLKPVDATQDYWFDWVNYHPNTTHYHAQYLRPSPAIR